MGACISCEQTRSDPAEENRYLNTRVLELESKLAKLEESKLVPGPNLSLLSAVSLKGLSQRRVDEFVNGLLSNPDTNISWLPDAVESRLYRNVATMGLASLESVLEGSNITIMGHKISFVLDPKEG